MGYAIDDISDFFVTNVVVGSANNTIENVENHLVLEKDTTGKAFTISLDSSIKHIYLNTPT